MGQVKYFVAFLLFCAGIYSPNALASVWGKKAEQSLIISSNQAFSSTDFQQLTLGTYVEYGLSDITTFGGKLDYTIQNYGGDFPASADGMSAANIFVQRQLHKTDNRVLSSKITYHAPTKLNRVSLWPNSDRPIRYGNAVELGVGYGTSHDNNGDSFSSVEISYRKNFDALADQLQTEFLRGKKHGTKSMLLAKLRTTTSVDRSFSSPTSFDLYTAELSYIRHRPKGRSYEIGIFYDLGGRNIEQGVGISLNFWRER